MLVLDIDVAIHVPYRQMYLMFLLGLDSHALSRFPLYASYLHVIPCNRLRALPGMEPSAGRELEAFVAA
jgi:hypothetical protein